MTVCVAAIASDDSVIICVADKALSFGDFVSWDSDTSKIIVLSGRKAVAMTAGNDKYVMRYLSKIMDFPGYSGPFDVTTSFLEDKFRELLVEVQNIEVLTPNGINRELYEKALIEPGDKPIISVINSRIKELCGTLDVELMVCGHSSDRGAYIVTICPPGLIQDHTTNGFYAIGEGAHYAISRLLFVEHKRTDGVAHSLFDCFDAKATAEMTPSVGYEWDGYFVTGACARPLLEEAKPLIDRVWAKRNRSPFKKTKDPDALPGPPRDWELKLRQFVAKSLGVDNDL
jgi:hypothetical protein